MGWRRETKCNMSDWRESRGGGSDGRLALQRSGEEGRGRMRPLGSLKWADCACACCKSASVWRGCFFLQGGHKNFIDGVCLTDCKSVCLCYQEKQKSNQWRLFHKNYSATSTAWWWWWGCGLIKTNPMCIMFIVCFFINNFSCVRVHLTEYNIWTNNCPQHYRNILKAYMVACKY